MLKLVIFFILTACQVGPKYTPPEVEVPPGWKNDTTAEEPDIEFEEWWEVFDDPLLTELERTALQNNPDLFQAYDRIQEAKAIANISKAALYPQINLQPSYSNTGELYKLFGQTTKQFIRIHELLYLLPLTLNYELDLWGRIRDQYDSDYYHYEATIYDYYGIKLSLTSDLAIAYYQLRTNDAQIDLLNKTIETRKKALAINQSRYEGQITNYADVSRAGLELENAVTQLYEAQRNRAIAENRIAVLIGAPASLFCLAPNPLTGSPPQIPAGIPASVLVRRPDILEAERNRASDNALVKEAVANFFPSLSLTGAIGYSSPALKFFLRHKSRYWNIGANSNQTVFDGFRKASILDLEIASFNEADDNYKSVVLTAFQEVEDSLSNIEEYANEYISDKKAVDWATTTFTVSQDRYYNGVDFYLAVSDSERDLLQAQILLNDLVGLQFASTVQLIKALGGGF